MPTSADTLLRLLNRMALPDWTNLQGIGADDRAKRKGCSYGMIVVDVKQRGMIDLLPNRTVAKLADWLRQSSGNEVVARGCSMEYAGGIAISAPTAVQVAERWRSLANLRQPVECWLAGAHGRLWRLPVIPDKGDAELPGTQRSARPQHR